MAVFGSSRFQLQHINQCRCSKFPHTSQCRCSKLHHLRNSKPGGTCRFTNLPRLWQTPSQCPNLLSRTISKPLTSRVLSRTIFKISTSRAIRTNKGAEEAATGRTADIEGTVSAETSKGTITISRTTSRTTKVTTTISSIRKISGSRHTQTFPHQEPAAITAHHPTILLRTARFGKNIWRRGMQPPPGSVDNSRSNRHNSNPRQQG